jgi:hypothetical protein
MTRDEAEKIAKLIGFADGGCPACVGALVECANGLGLGYQFEMTDEVVVRVIDPIDKTATSG